ncbi:MerR family transcriptional regulator [Streptomyces sp. NPDC052077]|uniref:DNA polymerase III subunit beta family protein n=1 Tax=Streptomyces sp. NPDC052077 TaxID=3154757 RepID=UPI003433432D
MPTSELMPIGVFARRCGLTASALRFYADSGLLPPAETDPSSGYRYYHTGQLERADLLRRLRGIAMPLATVERVLGATPDEAARLVDEHAARIAGEAADTLRRAAALRTALGAAVPGTPIAALKGPVLADAVEQVLTATAHEPGLPVLAGLRLEAGPEGVSLIATDRYRLSVRTLTPTEPADRAWAGTLHGDDLRAALGEVRRSTLVRLEATPHGVRLRMAGRGDRLCRHLPGEFPDHRPVLASLGGPTTRATVAKAPFLRALEDHPGERLALRVADGGVSVLPADGAGSGVRLPAAVTGEELCVRFGLTTLHPAVSTALGPDVMLDLRGPDRPVTLRSADGGDLTTLAMPVPPLP